MRNFLIVNEHPIERTLRIVAGLGIISLVFVGPKTPWAWFGLMPVLSGVTGLCPLYTMLGISTCRTRTTSS